eukprot:2717890-Rhodomonas_salina.1
MCPHRRRLRIDAGIVTGTLTCQHRHRRTYAREAYMSESMLREKGAYSRCMLGELARSRALRTVSGVGGRGTVA